MSRQPDTPTIVAPTKHKPNKPATGTLLLARKPQKQARADCRDKTIPNCPDYTTTVNRKERAKLSGQLRQELFGQKNLGQENPDPNMKHRRENRTDLTHTRNVRKLTQHVCFG